MFKKQETPDILDFNPDMNAYVEAVGGKLDYFDEFLLQYMKLWPEDRSSVDDSIFIYEFAEPFEDYKESLEVCIETIQSATEKTGVDRGEAKLEALNGPFGVMLKKYKRVYEKLPKKYRLQSGRKGLKALLKDAEAMENLYKP
jgi:hypothetical protein